MKRCKKILLILLGGVSALILSVVIININVIRTYSSFKKISNAPAYEITRYGSFDLDDYLKVGAKSTEELAKWLNKRVLHGINYKTNDFGCSAFLARTPDGDLIMARDFDEDQCGGMVLHTDGSDGYKLLGISNTSWIMNGEERKPRFEDKLAFTMSPYFMLDGMNEHGLSFALFIAFECRNGISDEKINLLDNTVCVSVLSKAKNVEEAIDDLSQYNIVLDPEAPVHFMFCDAEGNSAVVEYLDGQMHVTRNDKNYMICTNFVLYNNEKKAGLGSDRYAHYEQVLKETNGVISVDDALELLKKNTIPGRAQYSAVYNLTKKTLSVTFAGDYSHVYTYDFTR